MFLLGGDESWVAVDKVPKSKSSNPATTNASIIRLRMTESEDDTSSVGTGTIL